MRIHWILFIASYSEGWFRISTKPVASNLRCVEFFTICIVPELLSDLHFQHRLRFDLISEIKRKDLSLIGTIQSGQREACDTLYSAKMCKIDLSILFNTVNGGNTTGSTSSKRENKPNVWMNKVFQRPWTSFSHSFYIKPMWCNMASYTFMKAQCLNTWTAS